MPSNNQYQCPMCGSPWLPEFVDPAGVAVCPNCETLVRRSRGRLIPVGTSTEAVSRLVRAKMRGDDLSLEQIQERVKERVAARLGIKKSDVKLESHFIDDLGADSLDVVELVMALEEEFGVNIKD